MQSHIDSQNYDINPTLNDDNSNINMFFCADVVGSKRFANNFGGYPRSEIAEINAAADLNQQMNLLNQLNDYSTNDNPNAGLSDAEIMLSHRSKYCQTASEQISWLEQQIHDRQIRRDAAQLNKPTDTTIDFSETETPSES